MPRILVVDDDPDLLLMLDSTLEAAGLEVTTCRDPRRVDGLVAARDFDAAVLDVSMPEISGLDLLKSLRARSETASLPVLMLSALDTKADRVRGLRAGASDYLAKPFDPEELVLRLERLLGASLPKADISGNLDTYPCWELMQSLERSRRTGTLRLSVELSPAEVRFGRGQIEAATYGMLHGDEALLALLDLGEGSFQFRLGDVDDSSVTLSTLPMADFQSMLLRHSWLQDELRRRKDSLPSRHAVLRSVVRGTPRLEHGLDSLPVESVLGFLRQRGPSSFAALHEAALAAPATLDATIAVLVEAGFVVAQDGVTVGLESPPQDRDRATVRKMYAAVHKICKAAGDSHVHLLFLAEESSWPLIVGLVLQLPDSFAEDAWGRLREQLATTHGGTCTVENGAGRLSLHLYPLRGGLDQHTAVLPLCSGLVIWLGSEDQDKSSDLALRKLVARLTAPGRRRSGLVVAADERVRRRAQEIIANLEQVRVLSNTPADLASLLGLF